MNKEYKWSSLVQLFSYMALLGFVASLVVHAVGLMGNENPFSWNPMFLHIGVLVVGFPTAILSKQLNSGYHEKSVLKNILRGCPQWMEKGVKVVFVYGLFNFVLFSLLKETGVMEGSAAQRFSGHWLIFYYAEFAILHSYTQIAKSDTLQ